MPKLKSHLIQYVDDLLISSSDEKTHQEDMEVILQHLAESGLKWNPTKAQICKRVVSYLGHEISQGQHQLTASENVYVLIHEEVLEKF